jgi:hypothetical protein
MRIALIALGLGAIGFSGCTSEASIRAEIASANTCTQATDCVSVGTYCPYGCDILVNASQADRIQSLLESHNDNTCQYDCASLSWISCDAGACVGHFE